MILLLDSIEANVESAASHVHHGTEQLHSAREYQVILKRTESSVWSYFVHCKDIFDLYRECLFHWYEHFRKVSSFTLANYRKITILETPKGKILGISWQYIVFFCI